MKMIYFDNYSNFELAIQNHKQIVKRVVFLKQEVITFSLELIFSSIH